MVESYKNQESRQIFKRISISTTYCKNRNHTNCICKRLNPFVLIKRMIKAREALTSKLIRDLNRKRLTSKERQELIFRINNLKYHRENYLFVFANGKIARTSELNKIAQKIVNINQINESNRYKPYSFRIGGTTRASMVGINHTVILKYVGWKNSRLADCAQRYMRYPKYLLSKVPFEMIHGACADSDYRRKKPKKWTIYDPWSEKTNFVFYK